MTEEQMIELSRRAVACKGWRWMPGMLVSDGISISWRVVHDGLQILLAPNVPGWPKISLEDIEPLDVCPVLTDPATMGCLLVLVREAWGDPYASVGTAGHDNGEEGWVVIACSPTSKWSFCDSKTEAEALVAALEAAP